MDAVQELYGLGLKKFRCPELYNSKIIEKENPYPRGYKIPHFSLFSREDGQSTLKHVVKFTVQCEELANYENFYHFKLKLFPKSLTGTTFICYATLLKNFILSW